MIIHIIQTIDRAIIERNNAYSVNDRVRASAIIIQYNNFDWYSSSDDWTKECLSINLE